MIGLLRAMVREVARLPLTVKCLVAIAIVIEFVVVTQWERLTFSQPSPPLASNVTISPQRAEQPASASAIPSAADKARSAALEAELAKRMARVVIEEPTVETNGTITAKGQLLYLYGIKQFDSKDVCTKASGERWACGLHAYATLRNLIARRKITCDPQTILPRGVSATCMMGTTNIAVALVRDGLIELDGSAVDAEMKNAEASARSKRLGIWDR